MSVHRAGVYTCDCACVATSTRVKVGVLKHAGVSSMGCNRGTYGVCTVYLTILAGGVGLTSRRPFDLVSVIAVIIVLMYYSVLHPLK